MIQSQPSAKPARRIRTMTRKPKHMSLRGELSPDSAKSTDGQLTLFPLHPENLFEEKEYVHDHVHYFFDQDTGGATSLNGILGGGAASEDSFSPPSLSYACEETDGRSSLALAAFRHRDRDVGDEKWVAYDEVVELENGPMGSHAPPGLSLKLDYQEILDAWSDKGPLYIGGECAQTVPDQAQDSASSVGRMGESLKQLWNVPEDGSSVTEDTAEGKTNEREARVMRYKEKRQSRLFSKRIRYEVRKINAEKRPRMKGRFVKRKSDV